MTRDARRHRTETVRARRMREVRDMLERQGTPPGWSSRCGTTPIDEDLRVYAKRARSEHPLGCPTGRCKCGACSRMYGSAARAAGSGPRRLEDQILAEWADWVPEGDFTVENAMQWLRPVSGPLPPRFISLHCLRRYGPARSFQELRELVTPERDDDL